MKIRLPKNYRDAFTLTELEQARGFIAYMKEDGITAAEMLETIGRALTGEHVDVITAEPSEVIKDARVEWSAETGRMTGTVSGWVTWSEWNGCESTEYVAHIDSTINEYWQTAPEFPPRAYVRKFRQVRQA